MNKSADGKFTLQEGASHRIWTDVNAGTIVGISENGTAVQWQQDKAIRNPEFKPIFVPGGFCGTVVNQNDQEWTYERNLDAPIVTFRLRKNGRWLQHGQSMKSPGGDLSPGRREYYDYNF